MLKRSLLQNRQLEAIDALVEKAADALGCDEPCAQPFHVMQLAGTNMNDIQVGLASTLATLHDWRTLIIIPDTLSNSIPHLLKRASILDREQGPVRFTASPTYDGHLPAVLFATHGETREQIRLWQLPDQERDEATPPPLIKPDDYQLIIANNPNERRPEDYRRTLPFFTGARLRLIWMSAKPAQPAPRGSTRAGVVTFYSAKP